MINNNEEKINATVGLILLCLAYKKGEYYDT